MWGWLQAIVGGILDAVGNFLKELRHEQTIKHDAEATQQLTTIKEGEKTEQHIQQADSYLAQQSGPAVPNLLQEPTSDRGSTSSTGPSSLPG